MGGEKPVDLLDLYAKLSLDDSAYNEGLDRAQGTAESIGGKIKNGLANAAKAGAAAIGAATTAVVAFAKSSVEAGAQFDAAMSQVAAVSGATGDDFDALRKKAQEMGASTKFSATESAEAFNYMAMAGWKTEEMLGGIEGIMNLAAASGESLATTSDIVTDALTAFGLSAKDSGHFADVLAAASSNANTNVSMMGETFKYVAPVAGAFGFSAEDTALAIGLMANSGIKASQAGTSLRMIMNQLSGPIDLAGAALGEVTIQTTNADGSMRSLSDIIADLRESFGKLSESEQASAASAIVGKNAMSGFLALMNASEADVDKLSAAIYNADGAAQEMATIMQDNLTGDITIFKSALEGLQIVISDQLTPTLREFVQFGSESLGKLTEAFQEGGLGGAMGALGEIVSEGIAKITEKLPEMVDAGLQLIGALAQGLIDNIPTLVNAAIEIVTMLAQYVVDNLPKMAESAGEMVSTLASSIGEKLPDLLSTGADMVETLIDGFSSGVTNFIEQAPLMVTEFLQNVTTKLPEFLKKGEELVQHLVDGITQAIPALVQSLPIIIQSLIQFITINLPTIVQSGIQIVSTLAQGIMQALPQLLSALPMIIDTLAKFISNNLPQIVEIGVQVLMMLVNGITQAIPVIAQELPKIITSIVDAIINNLPAIMDAGIQILLMLINGIVSSVPKIIEAIPPIIESLLTAIAENLPKIFEAGITILDGILRGIIGAVGMLLQAAPAILEALLDGFAHIVEDIATIGVDIVKGIWNGITSMGSWLAEQVGNFFESIVDGVKDLLGIHSPSTIFEGIGGNMAEGVGIGWQKAFGGIKDGIEGDLTFQTGSVDYRSSALGMQAAGIGNAIAEQAAYSSLGGNGGQDIVINLTAELDGTAVARTQYRYNQIEAERRGYDLAPQ